jgi:hypothetical protein
MVTEKTLVEWDVVECHQGHASRFWFGTRGIQFGMAADVICLLTNYNPTFVWRDSETTEIAPHF